jgi:hypothetical protein
MIYNKLNLFATSFGMNNVLKVALILPSLAVALCTTALASKTKYFCVARGFKKEQR